MTVRAERQGRLATGVGTQGQGHFTAFAQIVAELLGVDVARRAGDHGRHRPFPWGAGTFASRGAVVAGSASMSRRRCGRRRWSWPAALRSGGGRSRARGRQSSPLGDPRARHRLGELRSAGQPTARRGDARHRARPRGDAYFGPRRGGTANGVHAMIVEVDPGDATVRITQYVVVHDCGRVHQSAHRRGADPGRRRARASATPFTSSLNFDEGGPTAERIAHGLPAADRHRCARRSRSPTVNALAAQPLGVKGVGRGRCIPAGAAFAQAIEDVRSRQAGLEILEIPLSPSRLFELTRNASNRAR